MRYTFFLLAALLMLAIGCDDSDGPRSESVSLTLVTEGLSSPLVLIESPDQSGRLFLVDQPGFIYILKDGQRLQQPFLDIRNKIVTLQPGQDERGLLGLAFHPNFQSNGLFYVNYSAPLDAGAPSNWNHTSVIAQYSVSAPGSDQANAGSEKIIMRINKPQANHNGGMLAFGHDGFLYFSVGDGGGADDVGTGHVDDWYATNAGGNGQDVRQNLMGSILRIDVNQVTTYGIPADNPFVGKDGMDEIYAYGFRNPYRFSFAADNSLIVADAGQNLYEEIDVVTKGGNYGWNVKEGRHCFNASNHESTLGSCPSTDDLGNVLIDPVLEFKNSDHFRDGLGNVSIGGYVYTGTTISFLSDKYLFGVLTQDGDKANGAIFAATRSGNNWPYIRLKIKNLSDDAVGYVLGFGQDKSGEMYVLTNNQGTQTGKVYKIGL